MDEERHNATNVVVDEYEGIRYKIEFPSAIEFDVDTISVGDYAMHVRGPMSRSSYSTMTMEIPYEKAVRLFGENYIGKIQERYMDPFKQITRQIAGQIGGPKYFTFLSCKQCMFGISGDGNGMPVLELEYMAECIDSIEHAKEEVEAIIDGMVIDAINDDLNQPLEDAKP